MKRRDVLGCGLAVVVAGGLELASFPAQAQSKYPERPIRLIVPFAPGGFEPRGDPPAEFQKAFRNDIKRYAEIVRAAKIDPE